jgi:hypothetical protein
MNNKANNLLQEIIDFRQGNGKFDFSSRYGVDKENAIFDAWEDIETRILEYLNELKKDKKSKLNLSNQ